MFERLPKPLEIALIAAMAVICAAVVLASPKKDSALFFASVPLFLVCAIMGFRRSERAAQPVRIEADEAAAEEVA